LLLGFSSGLPLLLVGSTLRFWLADEHVDLTVIGLFALVSLPYTLKFLWAPLLDQTPGFMRRIGRRRGWGLPIQLALAAAILALGRAQPDIDATRVAALAVLVAFLSASQDVVIDAYRIDMLEPSEYAAGSAIASFGYRLGMLAAGAGALYIAQFGTWTEAYMVMALLVVIGMAGMMLAPIPKAVPAVAKRRSFREFLKTAFLDPLADFMLRPKWPLICLFIVFYKLAPVLALGMTSPFYHDLGFSKAEVASVTKVFGLVATIIGGFVGVWAVARIGVWRSLLWCGVAQGLALYGFYWLAFAGHDLSLLVMAIGGENITGAMAATAFGTYIAAQCDKRFTATQFAMLTALMALGGDTLSAGSGALAKYIGWKAFFGVVPVAALPGLVLLWMVRPAREPA
jgi:PAT family beta-lactamase induction signal transducer AmpG